MLRKTGIAFSFFVLGSVGVFAAPAVNFNDGMDSSFTAIQEQLENSCTMLDNALNEKFNAATDPLEVYHKQLAEVKKPSYETLLPLLRQLAAYNAQFAAVKDEKELRALASKIADPAWAGWNDYRKIDFNEIYELYIPDNQPDKDIALLEYNVKSNTLSKEELDNAMLLTKLGAAEVFLNQMEIFTAKMQEIKKFDGAAVIKAFIPLITSYEEMIMELPAAAKLAKTATFKKPIACGWGRTYNVLELRENIGMRYYAGGDAFEYKTAEDLERSYAGITQEESHAFANFTSYYYKY